MDEQNTKIFNLLDKINERLDKLESTIKVSPSKNSKNIPKNIPFEKAYENCLNFEEGKGSYPCMYLPKSGKNKGLCCGAESYFVDNADEERTVLKGKVSKNYFYSFRCENCKDKGRANSESKKKCIEKIKGINVEDSGRVDEDALSFLAGSNINIISPTKAIPSPKNKPTGDEYIYDKHIHLLHDYNDRKYIFEYAKNKNNSPNLKKTPTLRGSVKNEDFSKEDYLDNIETLIKKEHLEELKKNRKFFFDGEVIEEKKEVIVPKLEVLKKVEKDEEITEDIIDKILEGINLE